MARHGGTATAGALLGAAALLLTGCRYVTNPSFEPYAGFLRAPAQSVEDELKVWFLGTSTLVLDDGETRIMTDGFFTRPSLLPMLLLPLESKPSRVRAGLGLGGLKEGDAVAAVFVAHSHHDHALDSARVAEMTGAWLVGSESAANVARGRNFPKECIEIAQDRERFSIGRFTVTAIVTPHSGHELGALRGEVRRPLPEQAWLGNFRANSSYAYLIEHLGSGESGVRRILIVPSATAAKKKNPFAGIKADTVFLATSKIGFEKQEWVNRYWKRTVTDTDAKQVVAIHWDDIRRPLSKDFLPIPRLQDRFHEGMEMIGPLVAKDVTLRLPRRAGLVDLGPRPAGPNRTDETRAVRKPAPKPLEACRRPGRW